MKISNFLLLISVIFLVIGCVQPVAKKPVAKKIKEYDEGFLVKKSLGVSSAKDLDGAAVCLIKGSKEEKIIHEYFKNNGMAYEIVSGKKNNELFTAYQSGRCDTILVKLNEKMHDSNSIILELK